MEIVFFSSITVQYQARDHRNPTIAIVDRFRVRFHRIINPSVSSPLYRRLFYRSLDELKIRRMRPAAAVLIFDIFNSSEYYSNNLDIYSTYSYNGYFLGCGCASYYSVIARQRKSTVRSEIRDV